MVETCGSVYTEHNFHPQFYPLILNVKFTSTEVSKAMLLLLLIVFGIVNATTAATPTSAYSYDSYDWKLIQTLHIVCNIVLQQDGEAKMTVFQCYFLYSQLQ